MLQGEAILLAKESMHMSTLTFLGAVGEVTGSRYLLEVDGESGPHRLCWSVAYTRVGRTPIAPTRSPSASW